MRDGPTSEGEVHDEEVGPRLVSLGENDVEENG